MWVVFTGDNQTENILGSVTKLSIIHHRMVWRSSANRVMLLENKGRVWPWTLMVIGLMCFSLILRCSSSLSLISLIYAPYAPITDRANCWIKINISSKSKACFLLFVVEISNFLYQDFSVFGISRVKWRTKSRWLAARLVGRLGWGCGSVSKFPTRPYPPQGRSFWSGGRGGRWAMSDDCAWIAENK